MRFTQENASSTSRESAPTPGIPQRTNISLCQLRPTASMGYNQAIFQNFSALPDDEYLKLLTEAVSRIEGDLVAESRHFIGELLDGPASYRTALSGDEVRQAHGLLDERSRPILRQLAASVRADLEEFTRRIDEFRRAPSSPPPPAERAATTVGRELAPGVGAAPVGPQSSALVPGGIP